MKQDNEFFGSLVVRMNYTKRVEGERFYPGCVRLVAFHGRLEEVKAEYAVWRTHNAHLADFVQATFELRMAVHPDEL